MAAHDGPRFSVVVTMHNHREFILDAVRSALDQSRAPMEVVVVDDGSTDGSGELIADAGLPAHCRLIRQANAGQLAAIRTGVLETAGDVICLLDSDDRWSPDYLERVAAVYAAQTHVDFVLSDVVLFGAREGLHGQFSRARDCGRTALRTCFGGHWETAPTSALSLRRSLLRRVLDAPPDVFECWRIAADTFINIGACALGASKYYQPTGCVHYRVHADNHWFGKESVRTRYRERMNNRSARNFFAARMHFSAEHLNEIKAEFLTHPAPCGEDFRRYAELNWRAPAPWVTRFERWLSMRKHFRLNQAQEAPPPRAMARRKRV